MCRIWSLFAGHLLMVLLQFIRADPSRFGRTTLRPTPEHHRQSVVSLQGALQASAKLQRHQRKERLEADCHFGHENSKKLKQTKSNTTDYNRTKKNNKLCKRKLWRNGEEKSNNHIVLFHQTTSRKKRTFASPKSQVVWPPGRATEVLVRICPPMQE